MSLVINDLQTSHELDSNAMTRVRGGFHWSYQPKHWLGPVNTSIKELTNVNTQLNIAVLSQGVFQNNSNSVAQF